MKPQFNAFKYNQQATSSYISNVWQKTDSTNKYEMQNIKNIAVLI